MKMELIKKIKVKMCMKKFETIKPFLKLVLIQSIENYIIKNFQNFIELSKYGWIFVIPSLDNEKSKADYLYA